MAKPWDGIVPDQLAARIIGSNENGCWLVAPNNGNNGYLRFTHKRTTDYAHRVAYRSCKGHIPHKHVVDHLCRNRACVNPSHLEAVPQRLNAARGIKGALTTHCPKGHEYSETNTLYRANGHRRCRTCHAKRERDAKRWRS
jgi:hypothetical protein